MKKLLIWLLDTVFTEDYPQFVPYDLEVILSVLTTEQLISILLSTHGKLVALNYLPPHAIPLQNANISDHASLQKAIWYYMSFDTDTNSVDSAICRIATLIDKEMTKETSQN